MDKATAITHLAICKRYERIAPAYCGVGLPLVPDRLTRMIDLEKVDHEMNIDWTALLAAPGDDFMHDVIGIHSYMDRSTGLLTDCFLPRYARPQSNGHTQ